MDSHKNHKAFVQMAKQTSGHNECCSAPSHVPFATYVKDIILLSTKKNSNRVIEFELYNNVLKRMR